MNIFSDSFLLEGNDKPKARNRENDELYLYKLGDNAISNILDKCNVNHIVYEKAIVEDNQSACKCKCMTTDKLSILSGMVNNIDADKEIMKIDSEMMYKMFIVDYLINKLR